MYEMFSSLILYKVLRSLCLKHLSYLYLDFTLESNFLLICTVYYFLQSLILKCFKFITSCSLDETHRLFKP